jgi:hypothetical protein
MWFLYLLALNALTSIHKELSNYLNLKMLFGTIFSALCDFKPSLRSLNASKNYVESTE